MLVAGDSVLGMNFIMDVRKTWLVNTGGNIQWFSIDLPNKKNLNEFLNMLDAEVATPDISGNHKVVFLRGLLNLKQFKEGLMSIVSSVSPDNTFLVFDETDVIRSDGKSKNSDSESGWMSFKNCFIKHGEVADVPPSFLDIGEIPWGARFGDAHVKAVVSEMAKRGKKISPQVVKDVFLEIVMPDWSFILMELDKLADLVPGDTITAKDVKEIVYPWEQKHAIFEFANVFNEGKYQPIIDSYDELVGCKTPPEMIFSFCMKLLRWQLIATHLISYGQPLPAALDGIGNLMTYDKARANTDSLRRMKPHLFKEDTSETAKDKDDQKGEGITSFVSRGVTHYVKDVLPRRAPIRNGVLGTLTIMSLVMKNYLTMLSCMEDYRLSGDPSMARKLFKSSINEICGRKT